MANKQGENWALVDLTGQNTKTSSGLTSEGGKLVVTIAGTQLPVAQFSMRYELNSIPDAIVVVALGRDTQTNMESAIYKIVDKVKQMAEAKVEITGLLRDWSPRGGPLGSKQTWPSASSIIFMGYVSGLTYRRTAGLVNLVINISHQLVDLTMSSGGSRDVVPGALTDLLLPTLTFGPGGEPAGSASTKFARDLERQLSIDFTDAILNCLKFVASENKLQSHSKEGWCEGDPLGTSNKPRVEENSRATKTITGFGDWLGINNYGKQHKLDVPSSSIAKASTTISMQISSSLAATSMWGMLIGAVLPDYGCGIIPTAQSAILAPCLPMARTHQISISPDDYVDFYLTCSSKRPLYGVGVVASYTMATSSIGNNKLCIGAAYTVKANEVTTDQVNDGMWMFVTAPAWMDDWVNSDPKAIKGNKADVNEMLSKPSHSAVGTAAPAFERNPNAEVDAANATMGKYAQMIYANNALAGREGTLVGKLRFDVAPGTTIKINSRGSLMNGVDSLAVPVFGFVNGVSIAIDAQQGTASTSFQLTNLRTEPENNFERYSMDKHPFFGANYFTYAPLVPGLSLPPDRS